ncbi:MAG: GspH/FimT family pseudopilin [Deltaproteobacteria bacterium]|nr:GspH/FimT family pseudopilin [Deltaproteobacteria bacterium]
MNDMINKRCFFKLPSGFTLLELMVTLAIAAILATVAIPGFSNLITSNRISSSVNGLLGAIHMARSEAVKLGTFVELCKKNSNSDGCTDGGNWEQGWLVREVADLTNIMLIHNALEDNYTVSGSLEAANAIRFSPSGETNLTKTATFVFCHDGAVNDYTRVLEVNRFGMGRVREDASATSC